MRCFTCGTEMKCFDDASNEAWGWVELLKCPKCSAYAETRVNGEGFIKTVKWEADHRWAVEEVEK